MTLDEALAVVWEEVVRRGQNRVADSIPVARGTLSKWKAGTRPEGEGKERLIGWATSVVRLRDLRTVHEPAPAYAPTPVATVVADGQRELAAWAQQFAAKILRANAAMVEAMPLPPELAGLPEAEAEEDAKATRRAAGPARRRRSAGG